MQNEIDHEKQARLMTEEHMRVETEAQEQRNKLILARLSHDEEGIVEQEAKLKALETREEALQVSVCVYVCA